MLHQAAAFNTTNIHSQGADWSNMNSSDSSTYKTTSDHLSMLMGSNNSYRSQNLENHHQQPKLENFLGRHSFVADEHHIGGQSSSSGTHVYNNNSTSSTSTSSSNIGLSMIKTWLRNQPAPVILPHHHDHHDHQQRINKNDINTTDTTTTTSSSAVQTLSLSMSTGSHTHHNTTSAAAAATGETCSSDRDNTCNDNNKLAVVRTTTSTAPPPGIDSQTTSTTATAIEAVPRKSVDTFGQRTSIYRGVTRHRWTGRYEAHLWDNSCRREGQTRKGRQVYLGGYDKEEKAARAYDLAALKYWGTTTTTNFPISNYEKEIDEMKHMTRQEYVASLRRKSSGFSRGASIYRGVTRHHQHGRWQARIGRVAGNKDLYLGTFSTQEEAAEAYDIAAIKFRGLNAVTNFDMTRYDVKSILDSSTLPIGGAAKRLKDVEQAAQHQHHEMSLLVDGHNRSAPTDDHHDKMMMMMMNGSTGTCHDQYHHQQQQQLIMGSGTAAADNYGSGTAGGWPTLAFNQSAAAAHHTPFGMHYYSSLVPYNNNSGQRVWCKQEQEQDIHSNTAPQSFYHHHQHQQQQQDQDQDLHHHQLLQLGSSHNFFQATGMDSMEHSSGSNSVMYSTATATNGGGGGGGDHGGYIIPMGTVISNDHNNGFGDGTNHDHQVKAVALGFENVFGSTTTSANAANVTGDAYNNHARNLYYLPQHPPQSSSVSSVSSAGVAKGGSAYDIHEAGQCNNWMPTAVPTSTNSNINMPPTFTVWNDT
ncbi:PREDICTED: AP2-like ethylene-responsive transcription factor BBM [Prunus mume]|uniref:AP2-like ethylene-responsive transcription factor BBM n=1 Tax=Prunus mume TaxID=102107 RepID=A0ABM0N2H3_PRUMU|nr:PREDICTED: AP2-like ethylene-responsive transcription factor BBM [Prunus mume]